MNAKKPKVGRPRSGKKPYLVRMTPTGHAALVRRAKAERHRSLGDWLDALDEAQPGREAMLKRMSRAELSATFCLGCKRISRALAALEAVMDYSPVVTESGHAAFDAMRLRYRASLKLAVSVGIVKS